tara:strand:- start:256 stop:702 length:447 start_codon:yes stop_codon:yes gene_type:complete
MANVNIKFNNKDYLLSCDDGQEDKLKNLASFLDDRFKLLQDNLGNIGENKLLLITIIKIIDEYFDLKEKVSQTKVDFEKLSNKFKELKSLAVNYKEEKEKEISLITGDLNKFKTALDSNNLVYEQFLDQTTKSIQDFIDKAETQEKIQ